MVRLPSRTWNRALELEEIYTPLEKCTCVHLGSVSPRKAGVSSTEGVRPGTATRREWGGRHRDTEHLQKLLNENAPLLGSDTSINRRDIESEASLDELLRDLSETRSVLVRDQYKQEAVGLVTISDLNRHEFRAILYQIFAELEAGLARLLTTRFSEPWDWIAKLADDHQAAILGHWEVAKRKGINIGPQAGATLTHLIKAVGSFASDDTGSRERRRA
jgi:hypothetical protein